MKTKPALIMVAMTMLSVAALPAATWTLYETAQGNDHRLAKVSLQAPAASASTADSSITLTPEKSYQEMLGFGGALTESSAWVLKQLPDAKRTEILRRYYDPKDGIGYTLGRTHMNSCDFSLNMWSLDDVAGDYDLHHFTLEPMRKWLMPLLHDTRDIAGEKNFKLLVSPWSPPYWMKTNYRMDDGGKLRHEYAAAWADFYVRFAQTLQKEEKISIWAFTVQNEPEAHQTWESCLYLPEEERDFVRDHLGPAFERAGLLTGPKAIKIIGWDHNRDRIEARADALLGDSETAKYFWGLGVHWYVSEDYAASGRVHQKFPDKPIIFTEGCCEGGKGLGAWSHGEVYAENMIGDFKNWVSAFFDWNIVLDQRGGPNHVGNFCDAPVIVDTNTKEILYGASFYYIGHFSRFVKPGAHRIESSEGPKSVQSIAFANPDGSLVTVVLNKGEAAASFAIAVGGETLTCTIPAHAIQSYVRSAK